MDAVFRSFLVLFLPEECGGGFFWEVTSGWMPYSDPSLVPQWIHISVSLRVGLVARGVRENWIFLELNSGFLLGSTADTFSSVCASVSSPEEYEKLWIFREMTSGFVPGSTLCLVRRQIHFASVYEVFWTRVLTCPLQCWTVWSRQFLARLWMCLSLCNDRCVV